MFKNKKIQELFCSQELNPDKFITKLATSALIDSTSISYRHKTESLDRCFYHDQYHPRMIRVDFSKGKEKGVCLIGKGILYDSGGYNIKSDASDMHNDKFGALTALLIGKVLKLPVQVFFAVNLINSKAILPGEIIQYRTKQVRDVNTDAEGRLGLASCIEDCQEYKTLITFATLTGHSVYSIGEGHAEVFSQDLKKLSKILLKNNKSLGIGRIFEDYSKCLYKNKLLENSNSEYREAGAAKAYLFLHEFLQKSQQLHHFDIAGFMSNQYTDYTYGIEDLSNACKILINKNK